VRLELSLIVAGASILPLIATVAIVAAGAHLFGRVRSRTMPLDAGVEEDELSTVTTLDIGMTDMRPNAMPH
jgi:hypothetical protein